MGRQVLNKLLSHSFTNYQILFNDLVFHNHNIHHLGSLYLLNATDEQLQNAYETMCKELVPYEISPKKITLSNWREHIGDKNYCKSYRDFFNEQLVTKEYNWKKKFMEFLLDNPKQPIINSVISGLAHPLIHIGYAFELDSQLVGIEALAMTAVCYNYLHEPIDKLEPPKSQSKTALEIFKNIHSDKELPIYDEPNLDYLEITVKNCSKQIFFYYNQWKINENNLEKSLEELFDLAVYLYGSTHKSNDIEFDFIILHLLTGMHAIRIIYQHIDDKNVFQHLLLQFFYFSIVIYITKLRPEINENLIYDYEMNNENNNWTYVIDKKILQTDLINDAHAVKVIRALRNAEEEYGYKNGLYLKTAIKTVDNIDPKDPWIFGTEGNPQLNNLKSS